MTKLIIAYLAGLATPLVALLAFYAKIEIEDRRYYRRYQRAWDKFSAEFDQVTPGQLEDYQAFWADEPWRYENISDDRGRYFVMRWKNGHTCEV